MTKADYDRSRYAQARLDVEREVRAEFNETVPMKLLALLERATIALEAIAAKVPSTPEQEQKI